MSNVGNIEPKPFSDGPETFEFRSVLPRLSVRGNRFVDPTGQTVVLRGLALSDPHHLEAQQQWGRTYFERAKEWHANLVRLPVHPLWWREWGSEKYFRFIDQAVEWCTELGMYLIIDWHTIGNPQNGIPHKPIYHTSREETFYFWYLTASRYQQITTVAFLELFNEPTNFRGKMGALNWSGFKVYMEELIDMIQHIDPGVIPLVTGFDWAYDLSHVDSAPIEAEGIAYVVHPYPQKRTEPWEAEWQRDWGYVAERYPVIATEFGFMAAEERGAHIPVISDERYGEAIIRFFEEKGISWTVWVFDPDWTPNLLKDWSYRPSKQGKFFKEVLQLPSR